VLWSAYQQALAAAPQPLQNGQQGTKSLGGVFFKELGRLKKRCAAAGGSGRCRWAAVAFGSRHGCRVACVLGAGGGCVRPAAPRLLLCLDCSAELQAAVAAGAAEQGGGGGGGGGGGPGQRPLRAYQQRCVERMEREGGNWIVVAPTGSGKTSIAVEHARWAG
jgi:hypothetical protein